MKILYVANIRLPTEKAHGIQIMKMCEAFAAVGHVVELVVPWRVNPIKTEPFEYYGVKKNFKITRLPSLDLVKLGRIGFLIQSFFFAETASWYVLFKKFDVIYSRDELPLFYLSFFKKNIFWEAHENRSNFIVRALIKKCAGIAVITNGLKIFYEMNGVPAAKILVAPDGVDINDFLINLSKNECRRRFNFPQDKKIAMYSGHLYDWKGADVLLDVAGVLKDSLFVFIGGTAADIEKFVKKSEKLQIKNSLILGHKPHREIPYYLKAADVLILPNRSDNEVSAKYTSPMKLFEYMASGTPIVASDLPSIREILNENNAVLVKPDNPSDLADGITKILRDGDLSDKISKQALEDVEEYTWEKRAHKILVFFFRKKRRLR